METKEQCKNCEIINADCEGCKEFNKNIRNSDSETKEKIERILTETEKLMEKYDKAIKKYDKAIKKMGKSIDRLGKVVEKGLKELEDDKNRN